MTASPSNMIGEPTILIDVKSGPRFSWLKMNPAAERYMGCSLKKIVESSRRCIVDKLPVFSDSKELMPDDTYRWGHTTYTPVFDIEENVRQIIITTIDITELMQTQERLQNSERDLEEALTKTLSGFTTICAACKSISHEGRWQTIEQYASERMGFRQFSHGMCPSCVSDYYGDRKGR